MVGFRSTLILVVVFLAGCSDLIELPAPETTPVGNSSSTGVSDTSPFTVTIQTNPSGTSTTLTHATCDFPAGTAVGSTTTCSASIPEGRLFTSDLIFDVSAISNECYRVVFFPYWYMASNNANFDPFWDSTDDGATPTANPTTFGCNEPGRGLNPIECFSGAATKVVPGFPETTGVYFLADEGADTVFRVPAATTNPGEFYSNRLTVNNNTALVDVAFVGDGYVSAGTAGFTTYQNYQFMCVDEFEFTRFQIDINITDEDGTDGDDYATW